MFGCQLAASDGGIDARGEWGGVGGCDAVSWHWTTAGLGARCALDSNGFVGCAFLERGGDVCPAAANALAGVRCGRMGLHPNRDIQPFGGLRWDASRVDPAGSGPAPHGVYGQKVAASERGSLDRAPQSTRTLSRPRERWSNGNAGHCIRPGRSVATRSSKGGIGDPVEGGC